MNSHKQPHSRQSKQPRPGTARTNSLSAVRPRRTFLAAGALVSIVLAAYLPALWDEFIWDDETNVTTNMTLRSLDGLRQMWFEPHSTQQYYPLMYTTYWLEYRLWGLNPVGYHAVNIFFHATAVLLVWRLLARLQVPGAWLGAALFAVHPVEVESVAWVTERKNVLSLSLALGSMLCYLRFSPADESGDLSRVARTGDSWKWYALALFFFALALFAKTVVVTLPAVLLVIYWWKRGRIRGRDAAHLIPFVALSVVMGLVTKSIETHHVGALGKEWSLSLLERFLLAGRALWFYAAKLAWPHPLELFYPRWTIDAAVWWQFLFPAAALALPVLLWLATKRIGRGPLAAFLIFAGVMLPALGFFNVYFMQYSYVSDHFQYHASVALIALAAAAAAVAGTRLRPWIGAWSRAAAGGLLMTLAVVTFRQTFVYHDLETLYNDTIAKNPNGWIAYLNLGTHFDSIDRCEDAIEIVKRGIRIKPDEPRLYACLGNALGKLSEKTKNESLRQAAFEQYQEAVRLNPGYYDVYHSMGFMKLSVAPDEAQSYFIRALQIEPHDAQAVYGLGALAGLADNWVAAQAHFERALEFNPRLAEARQDLVLALMHQGKSTAAIEQLTILARQDPDRAETHFELANLLAARGDYQTAARHYEEAVRLRPTYVEALHNLGAALINMGETDRAIGYLSQALRLAPDNIQTQTTLEQAREIARGSSRP